MKNARLYFIMPFLLVMGCQYSTERNQNAFLQQEGRSEHKELQDMTHFTHAVVRDTPYYKEGPQQGRPADGIFKEGVKLKVLKDAGSYLLVESAFSKRGFVAKDDLTKGTDLVAD